MRAKLLTPLAEAADVSDRESHAASDYSADQLVAVLEHVRQVDQVDPETWRTALRVIYTSVDRCSECRRGDLDYLAFAADFVRRTGAL